jgi:transposase
MFAVEIYAAVRKFIFVERNSRREAARAFGLSRDTIAKMCRYSAPPGYIRSKPPERPKLGPLVPVIDAILESDKTAPPKQRHTAKRIFERLRIEHGYLGGYTVVKDYVRLARVRSREVFIPLAHPPGHAQVDFGECIGVIAGVRMKLHVFCFDLPHSDACFIKAYPAETTEAFLDGHVSAFRFLAAFRSRFFTTTPRSRWRGFLATAKDCAPAPSLNSSAITCFRIGSVDPGRVTTRARLRAW